MCVLVADGQFERAARLLGSAEQMRAMIGAPRTSVEVPSNERCVTRLQEAFDSSRLEALMEEGRSQNEELVLAQIGQWESTPGL